MITPKLTTPPRPARPLDPRSVWGKVLLQLRKDGASIIHSICVDVGDITLSQNDFIINIHKSLNYETLRKSQNMTQLLDTFHKLGYNYNVILNFTPDTNLGEQDKTRKIAEILGCEIEKN